MFHYTNIPTMPMSDQSSDSKKLVKECLDDIDLDDVEYYDDPDDPEAIIIVVTGHFKQDAFKQPTTKIKQRPKDNFDDAKPF